MERLNSFYSYNDRRPKQEVFIEKFKQEHGDDGYDFSKTDDDEISQKPVQPKLPSGSFDIQKAIDLLEKLGYINPQRFELEMRTKTDQERRLAILELMHKASKETGNDLPPDISEEEMYKVDEENVKRIEGELVPLRKKLIELQKTPPENLEDRASWNDLISELKVFGLIFNFFNNLSKCLFCSVIIPAPIFILDPCQFIS